MEVETKSGKEEEEEWDAETQEGLGTAFGKGEIKKKEKEKRAMTGEVAATVAARGLVNGGTASEAQRWDEREARSCRRPHPSLQRKQSSVWRRLARSGWENVCNRMHQWPIRAYVLKPAA